jgi:competence protein ComEC
MQYRVLLYFTVGFAFGIVLASFFVIHWIFFGLVAAGMLVGLCLNTRFFPVVALTLGIAFGALRCIAFLPPGPDVTSYAKGAPVTVFGSVADDPESDGHKMLLLLSSSQINTHRGDYMIHDKLIVLVHGAAFKSFQDVRLGDSVKLSGETQLIFPVTNPGEFDWRAHLANKGVNVELVVQRPFGATVLRKAGFISRYEDWAYKTQQVVEQQFAVALPADEAGLLSGILFGDRRGISEATQSDFAATGTSHVLATAGLHTGILALCIAAILRILPIPRKIAAFVVVVLLWMFAALAGGRSAVIRAVSGATVYFSGHMFERVPDLPTTFAVAALVILAAQPSALFDSDFQMSFVTVAGLAIVMQYWEAYWSPRIKKIINSGVRSVAGAAVDLIGVSLVAQMFATPLIIYNYSQLSLLAILVNLLVVPILFLLIPCSFVTLAAAIIYAPAAKILTVGLLHPQLYFMLHVVTWFARLPYCCAYIQSPPAPIIVLIYIAAFYVAIVFLPRKNNRKKTPVLEPIS